MAWHLTLNIQRTFKMRSYRSETQVFQALKPNSMGLLSRVPGLLLAYAESTALVLGRGFSFLYLDSLRRSKGVFDDETHASRFVLHLRHIVFENSSVFDVDGLLVHGIRVPVPFASFQLAYTVYSRICA